jgi:site-specific DNA-methyltransferase (adenine-specific)
VNAVVLRGDARSLPLPDASVDLIVTSPPYWNLRDYRDGGESLKGQIGSEETWQEYIANLLDCTREWVRVLKPSGSMFVIIGDKYSDRGHGPHRGDGTRRGPQPITLRQTRGPLEKSLLGLPWRYALACLDQIGLVIRAENIWHKANGLPESVQDRPRREHEHVFHFTKQPRYYSALAEIREGYAAGTAKRYAAGYNERSIDGQRIGIGVKLGGDTYDENPLVKLPGSVWTIPSAPLTLPARLGVEHYAAFPPALARKCILGWSPPGICAGCSEGRRPVTTGGHSGSGAKPHKRAQGVASFDWAAWKESEPQRITGYACRCPRPDAPTSPAVVADPFTGTGTTLLVADVLGRNAIGLDLSADYCRAARWRVADPSERARAMQVPKPPPVPHGQMDLFGTDGAA